jgi:Na+/H+ antiporter NhaC
MKTGITVGIMYGTNIKTIYRHTSHEYTTIINDDTFKKNVKVQFYMDFYIAYVSLCSNILNCI